MTNKKFSFVIPIYNEEPSVIDNCINSIINQNIDYEIILVNDGSSNEEIDKYCFNLKNSNKNVIYKKQENAGRASALNNGLKYITGDYFTFVDADDSLQDNFFSKLKNISFADITLFDYEFIYGNKKLNTKYSLKQKKDYTDYKNDIYSNIMFYPDKLENFLFGSSWAKLFSTDFIRKNNISFVPNLRKSQDRVFMLNVMNKASSILYYPIQMYKYVINLNSITHKFNMKIIDYYKLVYDEMNKFCEEYNIEKEASKFVSYNIVNELLPLTIFNVKYKKNYFSIRKRLIKILKEFDFNKKLKDIKYSNIISKKGKIKVFLYKSHLYFLIYLFYIYSQNKEKKLIQGSE